MLLLNKSDQCSSIQDIGLNLGLNPSFPPFIQISGHLNCASFYAAIFLDKNYKKK